MKIKIKGDRTKIFKIILLSPVYLIIVSAYSSIKNEYKSKKFQYIFAILSKNTIFPSFSEKNPKI